MVVHQIDQLKEETAARDTQLLKDQHGMKLTLSTDMLSFGFVSIVRRILGASNIIGKYINRLMATSRSYK